MRETISSENGLSPPRRSADFGQNCGYTSIYTFTSSPTGSSLCGAHREGCIPHVFFLCCFFPSVSFPIPPLSPAVSSLSIPFPQLFPPSLPPSLSSGCMQQSTNSPGEAPKETARGLKQRPFGQKGSRTDSKRTAGEKKKRRKRSRKRVGETEGKGWRRSGSVGERRGGGGGKSCSCCSDGRSSSQFLRGQKFTVVLISPFRSQSELIPGCWKEL